MVQLAKHSWLTCNDSIPCRHHWSLGAPLQIQLPSNVHGKAGLGPFPHTRDLDRVRGFWLWPGPALAAAAIWGVNWMKRSLFLPELLCNSAFQIKF